MIPDSSYILQRRDGIEATVQSVLLCASDSRAACFLVQCEVPYALAISHTGILSWPPVLLVDPPFGKSALISILPYLLRAPAPSFFSYQSSMQSPLPQGSTASSVNSGQELLESAVPSAHFSNQALAFPLLLSSSPTIHSPSPSPSSPRHSCGLLPSRLSHFSICHR